MSGGLLALLDDVVALSKIAAASIDDAAAQAVKASAKAAGVVIDDAAVTPRYVVGLAANRELAIVWRIAKGSLFNKLVLLLPAALALSELAPWAITPLLMLGGLFLCYEGYEKLVEKFGLHSRAEHKPVALEAQADQARIEEERVSGAIRTDFILSAEIMAIALATLTEPDLATRGLTLAIVALAVTAGVYGAVALIVKADDAGVYLANSGGILAPIGRAIVHAMPPFLKALAFVGMLAMLWVGGEIMVHGLAGLGYHGPEDFIKGVAAHIGAAVPAIEGLLKWLTGAAFAAVVGIVLGALTAYLVVPILSPFFRAARPAG
ncbi:MAG: DUF808 domain-containing protein [Hyphomicrobium sp.]|nr:DUF808 domain-containing protein [Hyphomicrobium sp.]